MEDVTVKIEVVTSDYEENACVTKTGINSRMTGVSRSTPKQRALSCLLANRKQIPIKEPLESSPHMKRIKSVEAKAESIKERLEKKREGDTRRQAKKEMTSEEREELKMDNFFKREAWKYSNSGACRNLSEEERMKRRLRAREWRKNLTGEKKRRSLESEAKARKKTLEKMKHDPERKKRYLERHNGYARKRLERRTKEEKQEIVQKAAEWRRNLSEEKRQRYLESLKRSHKKTVEKREQDPERMKKFREYAAEYQRKRYTVETPEQRERRRYKDKICTAKRRLRKKLEEENVPKEEILRKLNQLGEDMWKQFTQNTGYPPPNPRGVKRTETIVIFPGVVCASDDFSKACNLYNDTLSNHPSPPCSPETQPFNCPHCSSAFPKETLLELHTNLCHVNKSWKCPKCRKVVHSHTELSQHYQSAHKTSSQVQPESCQEDSNVAAMTKSPIDAIFNFTCMCCNDTSPTRFATRLKLFAHVKTFHSKSFWPCEGCNLLKYSKSALSLHRELCRFAVAVDIKVK